MVASWHENTTLWFLDTKLIKSTMIKPSLMFLAVVVALIALAALAVTCNPSNCKLNQVCDVGCAKAPSTSFLDNRGCKANFCLLWLAERRGSSSPGGKGKCPYDCHLAVMNNLIHSFQLLACEAQTASEMEDLVCPIASVPLWFKHFCPTHALYRSGSSHLYGL
jgi:hypothetical protein